MTPTNFNSVERLIQDAFENATLVAEGQRPNSEQWAKALNKLNSIVNFQQTRGLKLFTLADTSLTLTSGVYAYTLGPGATVGISMTKPLRVIQAYYLDSSGNVTPMTPVSWQEWVNLQKAGQYGQPVNYFVNKQVTTLDVSVWPTPDLFAATGTVHFVLQQQIEQIASLTSSVYFPSEWYLGLMWALTAELVTGQPDSIVARAEMKKREYLADLEGWDVEDAQTFLTPDPRGSYYSANFS